MESPYFLSSVSSQKISEFFSVTKFFLWEKKNQTNFFEKILKSFLGPKISKEIVQLPRAYEKTS